MTWETTIGIEVHVELMTQSKMFCGCAVDFDAPPNTNICPVCLALPGALPVPNQQALEWITAIGLALNCEITPHSVFSRKNYFYADLPKNYQVSQFDLPVCHDGWLDVEVDGEVHRKRTPASRSTSARPAGSTPPPRRTSTSTAQASPWWRS
jgi:aspartyl-tRNA(Asn)/glutamyl-tRNA(Gln) amidotransferase subunit B